MEKVTQAVFVKGIAEEAGLHPNDVKRVLDALKNQIKVHVNAGSKVGVQGLGSWFPRDVASKTKTHTFGLKKGESYTTEPKTVIKHTVALGRLGEDE